MIFDILASGFSQSFSNRSDKTLSKLTKLAVNSRRLDVRGPDSPSVISNQVNVFLHQVKSYSCGQYTSMFYLLIEKT